MQTISTSTSMSESELVLLDPSIEAVEGLSERAQLVKKATQRIPVTAEQLVIGFYRADMLPMTLASTADDSDDGVSDAANQLATVQALKAAYVELSYENGYPTLPGGEPFWHKLDYEPGLAYSAFQIFLDMGEAGARELSELAENQELQTVYGTHIGRTPTRTELLQVLSEYHVLYYWRHRARAHDLFKEAAYRHIRIKRQMSAEDYHYRLAESLLKKVETYLGGVDFVKELTPKAAIEALKALVSIQRVSSGLPAAGPLPSKDSPEVTQFEAILRKLGTDQAANSSGSSAPRERSRVIDSILSDPSTARQMQELVIRVTTTNFEDTSAPTSTNKGRTFDHEDPDDGLAEDLSFHKDL